MLHPVGPLTTSAMFSWAWPSIRTSVSHQPGPGWPIDLFNWVCTRSLVWKSFKTLSKVFKPYILHKSMVAGMVWVESYFQTLSNVFKPSGPRFSHRRISLKVCFIYFQTCSNPIATLINLIAGTDWFENLFKPFQTLSNQVGLLFSTGGFVLKPYQILFQTQISLLH